jgi:hypothetical protein
MQCAQQLSLEPLLCAPEAMAESFRQSLARLQ